VGDDHEIDAEIVVYDCDKVHRNYDPELVHQIFHTVCTDECFHGLVENYYGESDERGSDDGDFDFVFSLKGHRIVA